MTTASPTRSSRSAAAEITFPRVQGYRQEMGDAPLRAEWSEVPDLDPCSAFGDTPEEALAEVKVAMELWLETARAHGMEIPEPRYRPAPVPAIR